MSEKAVVGGLESVDGKKIPLRGVDVSGEVIGGTARIRVRQTYENVEQKPIEAIYTFPLPTEGTLVGFRMECDGRRIDGVVKEREEAFRAYDDATLAGHGAALVEQERANVFTASVGNLLPGETTVVEVEYVQRLHASEGALRVMIPTLVAPRYIPGAPTGDRTGHGAADPTDRVPDADRISPTIADVDYRVNLDLTLHVGDRAEVSSPSHQITTRRDGPHVHVSFEGAKLDRDIVILAEGTADAPLQTVLAHKKGEVGTLCFSRVIDLFDPNAKPSALSVVFVLDRSGSMGGLSIEEARKALRLCLRQLREGDRFSIIAFDDREEVFKNEPVPFTQKTLEQADTWIASIDARGGTELLQPMKHAVEQVGDGVVVLLTDGQVGNEDEILAAVMAARKKSRIYAFGIGTNVSDALLAQLARRTGGAVEQIHPGERIDEKVVATFSRAIAPRVTDVRVKWNGVDVDDVAPTELPDLVDGEAWALFARYRKPGIGRLELRGTLRNEPWLLEVPLELPNEADAPTIEKFWAAERVRDLESIEVEGRRAKTMKDRIVEIAVAHQIASRHTSFIAIETRTGDRRVPGTPEARPIPVNAPAGWAMFQRPQFEMMTRAGGYAPTGAIPAAPPAMLGRRMAPPAPMAPPMAAAAPQRSAPGFFAKAARTVGSMFDTGAPPPPAPAMAAPMPAMQAFEEERAEGKPDIAFAIFSRQLASGLFDDAGTEPEDVRLVASTTRALIAMLREGIDAAHPLHGELVRKAITALLPLIAKISDRALARRALAAAWIAASGKRTRSLVEKAAKTASIDLRTGDESALRAEVLSA